MLSRFGSRNDTPGVSNSTEILIKSHQLLSVISTPLWRAHNAAVRRSGCGRCGQRWSAGTCARRRPAWRAASQRAAGDGTTCSSRCAASRTPLRRCGLLAVLLADWAQPSGRSRAAFGSSSFGSSIALIRTAFAPLLVEQAGLDLLHGSRLLRCLPSARIPPTLMPATCVSQGADLHAVHEDDLSGSSALYLAAGDTMARTREAVSGKAGSGAAAASEAGRLSVLQRVAVPAVVDFSLVNHRYAGGGSLPRGGPNIY